MEPVRAGEIHPLQNPSILKIIFENKKLTLKDLKSYRQVCREWRSVSSSAMRKFMPVLQFYDRDGKEFSKFLELVTVEGDEEAFSVPPFMSNFKLKNVDLYGDARKFWESCGSSIKILELSDISFESRDAFRHAIFQSCPNLEALTLDLVYVRALKSMEEPSEWVPPLFPPNHNLKSLKIDQVDRAVSCMELLSQFPALQKFEQPEGSEEKFLRSLAFARNHVPQGWQMKHLRFSIRPLGDSLETLAVLEDRRLPLESLHLDEITIECLPALKRIFAIHGPALKDLTLEEWEWPKTGILSILKNEVFKNLEALNIISAWNVEWPSFLRSLPNLKKLELSGISPVRATEASLGNWTVDSCTQLSIRMNHLETGDLRQLFVRLPNLERLEAFDCTNEKFPVICEFLPSLQHLILIDCKVDDIGISGLDEKDVARINEAGDEGRWPLKEARPNLSNLRNLKSLSKRDYYDWCPGKEDSRNPPDYTTAACLQKLPHLRKLDIPTTSAHPIWKRLREQFPWRD